MSVKTRCPHCQRTYALADRLAGERIRCKGCGETFRVEAAESPQDTEETSGPSRPSKKRTSRRPAGRRGVPLWVWLAAGAAALLVLLTGAVIAALVLLRPAGPPGGGSLTAANFENLRNGMSEAEVKAWLGPPVKVYERQPTNNMGQPIPDARPTHNMVWMSASGSVEGVFIDGVFEGAGGFIDGTPYNTNNNGKPASQNAPPSKGEAALHQCMTEEEVIAAMGPPFKAGNMDAKRRVLQYLNVAARHGVNITLTDGKVTEIQPFDH